MALGRLDDALAVYAGQAAFTATAHLPFLQAVARSFMALVHLLRADLTATTAEISAAEELFGSPTVVPSGSVASGRAQLKALQGDLDTAIDILTAQLDNPVAPAGVIRGLRVRYLLLQRGAADESVQQALAAYSAALLESDSELGAPYWLARAWGAEAIAAMSDVTDVRSALDLLSQHRTAVGFVQFTGDTFDHLRGLLALRLKLMDEAEGYFRSGLAICKRERCPIEAGRCRQGLAEVAESRGEHALAMEHLDAAGELFARHGAKLYLDQVIAAEQILKA